MRETWADANAKLLRDLVDAQGVTPTEAADLMKSLGELTAALSAFIVVAEGLYPHLKPRARPAPFPPSDGGILHTDVGETPH